MTIQKIAATAAVLGLTVGLSALPAQAANKTSSAHMAVWDSDHDGTLSKAELKSPTGGALARLLK